MAWQITPIFSVRQGILDLLGIAHPKVSFMSIASNDISNCCAKITTPDNRYLHDFLQLSERLNKCILSIQIRCIDSGYGRPLGFR
jgi:hypothetical protein